MLGFLFGLAVGASVAGGDAPQQKGTGSLLYLAQGWEGKEVDPMRIATCVTNSGTISDKLRYCIDKPDQWDIIRITVAPDGSMIWVLYRKQ